MGGGPSALELEHEKNRHQLEQLKVAHRHEQKMKELAVAEKEKIKELEIEAKKLDIKAEKVGIMAKLLSDTPSIADFYKLLDKNPNIFKEIGICGDAAGEVMPRMVETLQLEDDPPQLMVDDGAAIHAQKVTRQDAQGGENQRLMTEQDATQPTVDEDEAFHEREVTERDAQAGEYEWHIMEEETELEKNEREEQYRREVIYKKKQVDKRRSEVTAAIRSKPNPKLKNLLIQHPGAMVDMGLAPRAPTAKQQSMWSQQSENNAQWSKAIQPHSSQSSAADSSSKSRIQELD